MVDNSDNRGKKKWSMAKMLPEHVKLINKWGEERKQVKRPRLKDSELTIIMDEIEVAFKRKTTIKLTYSRAQSVKDDYGKVISIDPYSKAIVLDNPFGTTWYSINEIVAVTVID